MLEEIRYSYTRSGHIGDILTGIVVAPNPQDGVYIGPIVGRVGLNGHFQGMPNGLIAQALSPDRIALHHYDALSERDGFYQRDGVYKGRPTQWGQVMRVEYRDGMVISCHSTGERTNNWRQAERLIEQMRKTLGPRASKYTSRLTDGAQIGWDDEEVRR